MTDPIASCNVAGASRGLLARSTLPGAVWLVLVPLASFGAATLCSLPSRALPQGVRIDRLVVDKSQHRLQAWSHGALVGTYHVAIGRGGGGPKRYEGDGHTPEGHYQIVDRHPSREFGWFLHVSYPNAVDREAFHRGVADGSIPPGATIGGNVGIHGEPARARLFPLGWFNWTAGCMALSTDSAEALYRTVVPGAALEIRP